MTYKSLYEEGEMYDVWNLMRLRLFRITDKLQTHGGS